MNKNFEKQCFVLSPFSRYEIFPPPLSRVPNSIISYSLVGSFFLLEGLEIATASCSLDNTPPAIISECQKKDQTIANGTKCFSVSTFGYSKKILDNREITQICYYFDLAAFSSERMNFYFRLIQFMNYYSFSQKNKAVKHTNN